MRELLSLLYSVRTDKLATAIDRLLTYQNRQFKIDSKIVSNRIAEDNDVMTATQYWR